MRWGKDMNEDLEIMIDTKNGEWIDLGLPNSEPGENGETVVFVLQGDLQYRGGVAYEGGYIYEPAGAVHEATKHDTDTIYFVHVANGAIFMNEDGTEGPTYTWREVKAIVDAHNAAKAEAAA